MLMANVVVVFLIVVVKKVDVGTAESLYTLAAISNVLHAIMVIHANSAIHADGYGQSRDQAGSC